MSFRISRRRLIQGALVATGFLGSRVSRVKAAVEASNRTGAYIGQLDRMESPYLIAKSPSGEPIKALATGFPDTWSFIEGDYVFIRESGDKSPHVAEPFVKTTSAYWDGSSTDVRALGTTNEITSATVNGDSDASGNYVFWIVQNAFDRHRVIALSPGT